jgi:hypothetical protein
MSYFLCWLFLITYYIIYFNYFYNYLCIVPPQLLVLSYFYRFIFTVININCFIVYAKMFSFFIYFIYFYWSVFFGEALIDLGKSFSSSSVLTMVVLDGKYWYRLWCDRFTPRCVVWTIMLEWNGSAHAFTSSSVLTVVVLGLKYWFDYGVIVSLLDCCLDNNVKVRWEWLMHSPRVQFWLWCFGMKINSIMVGSFHSSMCCFDNDEEAD